MTSPTDHQQIINKLLKRPKVQQIVLFRLPNQSHYYSVTCRTRGNKHYAVLIDETDFSLLGLGCFTIQTIGKLPYIRSYRNGRPEYLHRLVLPSPKGYVTHHIMDQFDVRTASLQVLPRSLHMAFHRELNAQRSRPIHPKNHFLF